MRNYPFKRNDIVMPHDSGTALDDMLYAVVRAVRRGERGMITISLSDADGIAQISVDAEPETAERIFSTDERLTEVYEEYRNAAFDRDVDYIYVQGHVFFRPGEDISVEQAEARMIKKFIALCAGSFSVFILAVLLPVFLPFPGFLRLVLMIAGGITAVYSSIVLLKVSQYSASKKKAEKIKKAVEQTASECRQQFVSTTRN